LLRCAYDNCTVTAELKKNRYTYYHCTAIGANASCPTSAKKNSATGLAPSYETFTSPTMC